MAIRSTTLDNLPTVAAKLYQKPTDVIRFLVTYDLSRTQEGVGQDTQVKPIEEIALIAPSAAFEKDVIPLMVSAARNLIFSRGSLTGEILLLEYGSDELRRIPVSID